MTTSTSPITRQYNAAIEALQLQDQRRDTRLVTGNNTLLGRLKRGSRG